MNPPDAEKVYRELKHEEEIRAHDLAKALSVTGDPLCQLPMELSMIGPFCSKKISSMITRYNMDQFDRLTASGYFLNFLTQRYERA